MNLLKIELTDRCNSHCVFCERDKAKNGLMPLEMFKAIVDEFPDVKEIHPQYFGEPMMHPQFFDAVEYLKLKGKRVVFYTNGSLLTEEKRKRLAELEPDEVIFSVEAHSKGLYETLRPGLKWEVVLNNIRQFQAIKRGTRTTARMTVTKENRMRIKEVDQFWRRTVDSVHQTPEFPAGRDIPGEYNYTSCRRPWDQMIVKWNGDIVLCCVDLHADHVMGNVREGANNVWNGDKFKQARERVARKEKFDLCNRCAFHFKASS